MKSNSVVYPSAAVTLILIIGVLLDFSPCVADELVLSDGRVISGSILSATEDSVEMKTGHEVIGYAHEQVSTYRFAVSDVALMKSGEEKELKILRKEGDWVVALVPAGIENLFNNEIKKIKYNRGPPLESATMAATGIAFRIAQTEREIPLRGTGPTISIGVRLGGHIAVLEDWKDQFVFESDEGATELGLLGVETIVTSSRSIYFGLGLEFLMGKTVEIAGGVDNQVSAWMYFATFGLATSPRSKPNLTVGGALDVGHLSATETVNIPGMTLKATGGTIAVRPKFRMTYLYERNVLFGMDLGILFANAKDISVQDVSIPGYSLDFSGLTFTLNIAYITNL